MNMQKNQAFSSLSSRDKFDLKILQSDCPRAFWPISQSARIMCKNAAVNIHFLYGPNSEKING